MNLYRKLVGPRSDRLLRGRGPARLAWVAPAVWILLFVLLSTLVGSLPLWAPLAGSAPLVVGLVLVRRSGLYAEGEYLRVQGVVTSRLIPVDAIRTFRIERVVRPLDLTITTRYLVVDADVPVRVTCVSWIDWSPLTGATVEALSRSQIQLLDRLDSYLQSMRRI